MDGDEHKRTGAPPWQRWAFAAVPAVGLLELGAHAFQTHSVVPDSDWQGARQYVASQVHPEDLVAFAPGWVDPIGRQEFGPDVATLQREARPDETRFPRAFEVSIRGAHEASLDGWRKSEEHRFGAVTVTTLENPAPVHVLEDLVSLVEPRRLQVSRVDGDHAADCPFGHGAPQSGGLGAGPTLPADRLHLSGRRLRRRLGRGRPEYRPHTGAHLCAAPGGRGVVRMRFLGVTSRSTPCTGTTASTWRPSAIGPARR